jgi:hypothetical protein
MSNLNWNARTPQTQLRQKQKRQGGIQEDWKVTSVEEAHLAPSEDLELDSMSDDDIKDDEETGLTERDKRKRRKRNRNTRIDQRVVRESAATAGEKREANQAVLKKVLTNCLLILLW